MSGTGLYRDCLREYETRANTSSYAELNPQIFLLKKFGGLSSVS